MRIFIDLTALADNFSGIERYAASVALNLIEQSEDIFILAFKESIPPMFRGLASSNRVEMMVLPRCNKLLFNQIRLPLALRKVKADWYLFMAFPAPVLLFRKNMVSTIHDICCWDCPETMNGMSKWYFRISYRAAVKKCKAIITVSEFSKKRIMEKLRLPEKNIWLICNGISSSFKKVEGEEASTEAILAKYKLPKQYILTLSTIEPRKNIQLLVKAYRQMVLRKEMDRPLVLAGRKGWKMDELLEGIEPSVKDKIFFTGFIEDEDLPVIYGNAEFFVFPSMYEGFGIPPLEAMACGTPVLSSNAASLPEVLGDAAVYFKSGDEADLQSKMLSMLKRIKNDRENMRPTLLQQAGKFTWSESAKALSRLLHCNEDNE